MTKTPQICLYDQEKKTVQRCHQHNVYRTQVSNHKDNLEKNFMCAASIKSG